MSWVGPEFQCGECGGTIARWPIKNMLRQDTLDWKHVTVPPGVTAHRAILGTPVRDVHLAPVAPQAEAESSDDDEDAVVPDPVPPPEVPARPAMREEMPSAAKSIDLLADANGWRVEAWYMRGTRMNARWQATRVVADVVLRMERDRHRLVASWQTKPWRGVPFTEFSEWAFETAFSLTHHSAEISSTELRRLIQAPRMICEECGETFALHPLVDGQPVCFTDWKHLYDSEEI